MSDEEEDYEKMRTEDFQILKIPRGPLLQTAFWSRLLARPRPFPCWTIPNTHFAALRLLMTTLIPDAKFPDSENDDKMLAIILHAAHLGVKYHMPIQVTKICTILIRHLFGQFLYQTAIDRFPRRDLHLKAYHLARAWKILTDQEVLKANYIHPLEIAMVFALYVPFSYMAECLKDQDADFVRDVEYMMEQQPEMRRTEKASLMLCEYRDSVDSGYTGPFAERLLDRLQIMVPEWYEAEITQPPTAALRDIEGDLDWELTLLCMHPWNKTLEAYRDEAGA
ncbi:hypothetical protein CDD81_3433 [Ophiocordyceps australis]|uniref:Uncharacterized protein n=1 Tax=Ophiocordyceps australis TaxID=1399860 RepID=A0A2C5Y6C5_9HYPO|nr:hypothetical protein CDD81_3433 [Ophiocordyceps australis]